MKKSEQKIINDACMEERKKAIDELEHECATINGVTVNKLRTCTAHVYITTNYYILQSYNTIIAVINRKNDALYDFLRIVYGYTATSCQHIAKFKNDYQNDYMSARYTAR